MMVHPSCCPVIVPPPCPKCGAPMVRVYDDWYSCSKDHAEKMAILKKDIHAHVEPVHMTAILGEDGKFYFEGDFEYTLRSQWPSDEWPPKRVGHVVI